MEDILRSGVAFKSLRGIDRHKLQQTKLWVGLGSNVRPLDVLMPMKLLVLQREWGWVREWAAAAMSFSAWALEGGCAELFPLASSPVDVVRLHAFTKSGKLTAVGLRSYLQHATASSEPR